MAVTAHDVAAYILTKAAPMTTMKLQKLLYYSQAWHLAWRETRLYTQKIEAWANGPVVYEIFAEHRGQFNVDRWDLGEPQKLDEDQRDTIDRVIASYGELSGRQLSKLTHSEGPWRQAREGYAPTDRANVAITPESMQEYYSALDDDPEAKPVSAANWRSTYE